MAGSRGVGSVDRDRARPRVPLRERGVARYSTLLNATERLLTDGNPDSVGLYQIAKAAGVPPASVYHFFPTKEAAFVALVQRYVDGFAESSHLPARADQIHSWQDLMALEQDRARRYYTTHPAALKLLYGGYGGLDSRKIDIEFVSSLAQGMYGRYDNVFHMPYIADPARMFHISLTIMDSIWSLSYLRHSKITDEYALEALAACYAYCRLFLPERVELRQHFRDLAEQGREFTNPIK